MKPEAPEILAVPPCSDDERNATQLDARRGVAFRMVFASLRRETDELTKMTRHCFKVPRRH